MIALLTNQISKTTESLGSTPPISIPVLRASLILSWGLFRVCCQCPRLKPGTCCRKSAESMGSPNRQEFALR